MTYNRFVFIDEHDASFVPKGIMKYSTNKYYIGNDHYYIIFTLNILINIEYIKA